LIRVYLILTFLGSRGITTDAGIGITVRCQKSHSTDAANNLWKQTLAAHKGYASHRMDIEAKGSNSDSEIQTALINQIDLTLTP